MTIDASYFKYLDHFSNTITLSELREADSHSDLISLRHDIDHDIDIALEFAYHENKNGFKATYFILHDHEYNADPFFLDKIIQLQDYGHEVGVHLNLLAGWLRGDFDDPGIHLHEWLTRLRTAGIKVCGTATHGDKSCYQHGVINNWFFLSKKKNSTPIYHFQLREFQILVVKI